MRVVFPQTLIVGVIGIVLSVSLFGCGRTPADSSTVPVSGRITLDGKPLEGAAVAFRSTEQGFGGRTGADGRYELKPGALPGTYKVDISKYAGGSAGMVGMDPGAYALPPEKLAQLKPLRQLIPARYSNPSLTELTFTVPEPGTDSADFDLTAQ